MDDIYNNLLTVVADAMKAIEEKFFNFIVANGENPIKRERVYCGELYHQMRLRFDDIDYDLNNEPNKKGHPIIEELCGPIDPDFVVHRMGNMGPLDNLAVIEVKRSHGDLSDGIKKDMKTINCMTTIKNGYHGGIIIVYGDMTKRKKENLLKRIIDIKAPALKRLSIFFQAEPKIDPEIVEL